MNQQAESAFTALANHAKIEQIVSVRMRPDEAQWVKSLAQIYNVSQSEVIRQALKVARQVRQQED